MLDIRNRIARRSMQRLVSHSQPRNECDHNRRRYASLKREREGEREREERGIMSAMHQCADSSVHACFDRTSDRSIAARRSRPGHHSYACMPSLYMSCVLTLWSLSLSYVAGHVGGGRVVRRVSGTVTRDARKKGSADGATIPSG